MNLCFPDFKTRGFDATLLTTVGRSVPRCELAEEMSSAAQYSADTSLPGTLHSVIIRSPYPRADPLLVDANEAQVRSGVSTTLTCIA